MVFDFDAFREHGEPTYFDAVDLPWEADLVIWGLVYCFSILFLSFCLLVPGVAGKEKYLFILRVFISLSIGASLIITNFAMTWDVAETTTTTKYKAGTGQEINATIGVHIGLRGVNITLKADDHQLEGETINYNERFNWEGLQGRQGFGPFAGRFNQEYRAAQFKGLPLPILWVAEYFTLDGEGIRWGRYYRQAGYYTHIMLWLSFPLWIMTNVMFFVLLRYGAIFMMLTGISMVTANVIWTCYRNSLELKIPFTEENILDFTFGLSFWICLTTGILCILLGAIVFFMDKRMPRQIAMFFGVDVLQDSEKIQVEEDSTCTAILDSGGGVHVAFNQQDGMSSYPASPSQEDDIYEDSSVVPIPNALNVHNRAAAPLPMTIEIPGSRNRSFKTSERRWTKRLQRPRRKEQQSSDYFNAPPAISKTHPSINSPTGDTGDDDMFSNTTRF